MKSSVLKKQTHLCKQSDFYVGRLLVCNTRVFDSLNLRGREGKYLLVLHQATHPLVCTVPIVGNLIRRINLHNLSLVL